MGNTATEGIEKHLHKKNFIFMFGTEITTVWESA
jgi:hypothetical protein